jgi:hypothetical protein
MSSHRCPLDEPVNVNLLQQMSSLVATFFQLIRSTYVVICVIIVEAFVASGGIPTRGHGGRHVGIFVGTKLLFCFSENCRFSEVL